MHVTTGVVTLELAPRQIKMFDDFEVEFGPDCGGTFKGGGWQVLRLGYAAGWLWGCG